MGRHGAVVVRKSKRDEAQVSLAQQERRGRELLARVDPELPVVVYSDEARSGADMQRHGWQSFVDDVRRGDVAMVATYEQSRLTRAGSATWDEVCVLLSRAGIGEVLTHRQGVVSVVEGNRLQGRLLAVVDQEERERAIVRAKDAHRHLAEEGRPSGGRPYGYRSGIGEDGKRTWVIDPDEAAVIRRLADGILAGRPIRQLAVELNAEGIRTAKGRAWGAAHVRAVVTKPSVTGLRSHHGEIVGEATWQPILERDTWVAVVSLLSAERVVTLADGRVQRVPRTRRRTTRRLLSPVAVCGRCGGRMVGGRQRGPGGVMVEAYVCHVTTGPESCGAMSIRADRLDGFVEGAVIQAILDRPEAAAALSPRPVDVDGAVAELVQVEDELAALGADYGAGRIHRAAFDAAQAGFAARADALRHQIDAATPAVIDDDPASIPDRWPSMPLVRQQAIVAGLLTAVVVLPADGGSRRVLDRHVRLDWRV